MDSRQAHVERMERTQRAEQGLKELRKATLADGLDELLGAQNQLGDALNRIEKVADRLAGPQPPLETAAVDSSADDNILSLLGNITVRAHSQASWATGLAARLEALV